MRKLLILTISLFFFLLFATNMQVHAQSILNTHIERIYTASEDYMQVSEKKTTTVSKSGYLVPKGEFETFVLQNFIKESDEREEAKLEFMKDSIEVLDNSGKSVNFTATSENGNLIVRVAFPRTVRYQESYAFTINYRSLDLVKRNGNIYDVYIIPFSKDYQFSNDQDTQSFTSTVRIPKSFGEINFALPNNKFIEDGNYIKTDISTQDLQKGFAWIQVGTKQYYSFKLILNYGASLPEASLNNNFEITLPRDITTANIEQRVYFDKFLPEPKNIKKDVEGNLIAQFEVDSTQQGQILITGYAEIEQTKVDFKTTAGLIEEVPEEFKSLTTAAPFWEVNEVDIQKKAQELKISNNVYELVDKTYKYIVDSIDYAKVDRFGLTERKGALSTLHGGGAVCMEYSDLFITLMRAQGIPARAAYGHGYDSRIPLEEQVGHQWAEVYFPGINQWVAVDVTWGETGQTLIGGDLNHLYTHIASTNPDEPPQMRAKYYGTSPVQNDYQLQVEAIEQKDFSGLATASEIEAKYFYEPNVVEKLVDSVRNGLAFLNANVTLLLLATGIKSEFIEPLKVLLILSIVFIVIWIIVRGRRKSTGKLNIVTNY